MWTPTIVAVDKVNGRVRILVSYASDVPEEEVFSKESFATTLDGLKREVQAEIDRVSKDFTFADSIATEIGKPFDTTIIPPTPDPAEVARAKYFRDLAVLNTMIRGIESGIRKPDDPDYLDQLALVKSEFLPDYEQPF